MMQMKMMLNLRPKIWEQYPIVVPPDRAPRLATTCVTVTALGEKRNSFVNMVGYRSWLPWDMKLKPAISRTR